MEERFFGFSQEDIRHLAYKLALRNVTENHFTKYSEKSGEKQMRNFFKRNSQLAVSIPQVLSFSGKKTVLRQSQFHIFLYF
jgi:hypothetical protein